MNKAIVSVLILLQNFTKTMDTVSSVMKNKKRLGIEK